MQTGRLRNERVMNKSDRRVVRTRRAIREALIELSLEIGYERVTVRRLTDRADIAYATFYRHYQNKDEVLTECFRSIVQEVNRQISPDMTHYEESLIMFKICQNHAETCLFGTSLPRDHPAIKPVWDEVADMVFNLYTARSGSPVPLKVSVNHLICSVVEMIRWWLTDGQEYTPEEMATIQCEIVFADDVLANLEPVITF